MKIYFNVEIIDNYLKSNNLTKKHFCYLCDISYTALKNIYLGKSKMRTTTIIKIINVLNVRLADFVNVCYN